MPYDRIHPQECGKLPVCTGRRVIHENVAVRFLCVTSMGLQRTRRGIGPCR
jgi:hypothetical protein